MPKKKVLIVDDNVSFAEFLDATVRSAGFQSIVAHDGEAALEKFRRNRPNLVFLDVLLPKKDGFKVCQEIRAIENGPHKTPIVLMTGIYKKRNYQRDGLDTYGAREYLLKPFAITDVWRILDAELGPGEVGEPSGEFSGGGDDASALHRDHVFAAQEEEVFGGTSLRDRSLASILQELHQEHKTGLLFLKSTGETDIFFVERGEVVFVRSSNVEERLDRLLLRSGRLSTENYEKAQALLVESRGKARMGEILVGMGVLNETELRETLQYQLGNLILRAFRTPDAAFTFVAGDLPTDETIRVNLPAPELIYRGVQEMPDEDIRRHLPGDGAILLPVREPGSAAPEVNLRAEDRKLLELLDGTRNVATLLHMGKLANGNPARSLLGLIHAGLVRELTEQELAAVAPRGPVPAPVGAVVPPSTGDLALLPVPILLRQIHAAGASGVVTLHSGNGEKWLLLRQGQVVYAGSNDPADRLGEVLVSAGMAKSEEIRAALDTGETGEPRRIGQVLVDRGVLSLEDLHWAVVFQLQKIVQSCFAWDRGRYEFEEGKDPGQEAVPLNLGTLDLLLEGVRRMPESVLDVAAPKAGALVRKPPGSDEIAGKLRLSEKEKNVRAALDGECTVQELARRALLPLPEIRRAVLAQIVLGVLESEAGTRPVDAASTTSPSAATPDSASSPRDATPISAPRGMQKEKGRPDTPLAPIPLEDDRNDSGREPSPQPVSRTPHAARRAAPAPELLEDLAAEIEEVIEKEGVGRAPASPRSTPAPPAPGPVAPVPIPPRPSPVAKPPAAPPVIPPGAPRGAVPAVPPETPHARPAVPPEAPHARPAVPPEAPHARPAVPAEAPHARPAVPPEAPHARPAVPAEAPHARPAVTPEAPHASPAVSAEGPHATPSASTKPGEHVPRFLYEELLRERRELEATLFQSHRKIQGLEKRLAEVLHALQSLRDGLDRRQGEPLPDRGKLVLVLDEFLLRMGDMSRLLKEVGSGEVIQ